ncbi:SMI1/KNR4 family protein [Acinetobacter gandensis]|uniref:Knr4/Smi1-like domain-containing protein n=1 Tax=Acinetobacter gandensis TaxID=1443941 RepID=A0A1A7R902_9GAMM|nr:SMI1/KNR4 family protein [Acinetobacter gandensis]KAB0625900.1 SMI1/KNR4 family protein [Acinetobacter gandensis]OBX27954.1 hypothetical protein A9J31_07455 [Acinetobacter gandensis]
MNILKDFIKSNAIDVISVSEEQILQAQQILKLDFDTDYLSYLQICGQLEFEYLEFYGLGVNPNSHLNVIKIYSLLKENDTYPKKALPLLDLGDGHYSIYDIETGSVLEWTKDGLVGQLSQDLEQYLLNTLNQVKA